VIEESEPGSGARLQRWVAGRRAGSWHAAGVRHAVREAGRRRSPPHRPLTYIAQPHKAALAGRQQVDPEGGGGQRM
jgi:hypothetical protein